MKLLHCLYKGFCIPGPNDVVIWLFWNKTLLANQPTSWKPVIGDRGVFMASGNGRSSLNFRKAPEYLKSNHTGFYKCLVWTRTGKLLISEAVAVRFPQSECKLYLLHLS